MRTHPTARRRGRSVVVVAVAALLLGACGAAVAAAGPAERPADGLDRRRRRRTPDGGRPNPVVDDDFPDPDVLEVDGVYYAYATEGNLNERPGRALRRTSSSGRPCRTPCRTLPAVGHPGQDLGARGHRDRRRAVRPVLHRDELPADAAVHRRRDRGLTRGAVHRRRRGHAGLPDGGGRRDRRVDVPRHRRHPVPAVEERRQLLRLRHLAVHRAARTGRRHARRRADAAGQAGPAVGGQPRRGADPRRAGRRLHAAVLGQRLRRRAYAIGCATASSVLGPYTKGDGAAADDRRACRSYVGPGRAGRRRGPGRRGPPRVPLLVRRHDLPRDERPAAGVGGRRRRSSRSTDRPARPAPPRRRTRPGPRTGARSRPLRTGGRAAEGGSGQEASRMSTTKTSVEPAGIGSAVLRRRSRGPAG